MSDEEWSFFAPFLTEKRSSGGRPPRDHRLVLDAIFWIARTGAPWRDLPTECSSWNSVFRQYRRWTEVGIWEVMLEALATSECGADAMHMIDSTIIRAHHHAAGGKGGFKETLLAVRAVASRPKSTPAQMPKASQSPSH
jgi:transposase